jgi:hypothetical protein
MELFEIGPLVLTVLALGALQGLATWRVWHSDLYERAQKSAQTRFIWALPLIGATVVLLVLRDAERVRH